MQGTDDLDDPEMSPVRGAMQQVLDGHEPYPALVVDGIATALNVMRTMADTGRELADLASELVSYPQVLVNVRVADRDAAMSRLSELTARAGAELGDDGRVLVRPSAKYVGPGARSLTEV